MEKMRKERLMIAKWDVDQTRNESAYLELGGTQLQRGRKRYVGVRQRPSSIMQKTQQRKLKNKKSPSESLLQSN